MWTTETEEVDNGTYGNGTFGRRRCGQEKVPGQVPHLVINKRKGSRKESRQILIKQLTINIELINLLNQS